MTDPRHTAPTPKSKRRGTARRAPTPLGVLYIAPAAQAWLESTSSARVLHVFERACNLINDRQEVLSLVGPLRSMGPFAAVVRLPDSVQPDFTTLLEGGQQLSLDRGMAGAQHTLKGTRAVPLHVLLGPVSINASRAYRWLPRPAWDQLRKQSAALSAGLPLLGMLLKAFAPPGSFAPLMDRPAASGDGSSSASFEARFLEAARQPAQLLRDGILTADLDVCRAGASKLAGLGSGLTPSGDDFMLGVLYALWATQAPEKVAPVAQAILESAVPRTVPLSAAWLRAAARGEAGQLWHALVAALAAGDQHALVAAAHPIIRTGHTSGADALAGFLYMLV